ncbi:MAG: response regulator, partial [Dehalococcoidia bacterium]|nr:response regulator [Dehalococcoidia bacterium]
PHDAASQPSYDLGVAVVATYPSPMGGIGPGVRWSPASASEASVHSSGEPSLDGDTQREAGASPLSRLPAFGLHSRVLLPLYAGAAVAGVLALYRTGPRRFDARDGILAERTVRRLGETLAQPGPSPAAGDGHLDPPSHEAQAAPTAPAAPAVEQPSAAAPAGPLGFPESALPGSRLESLGELVAGVAHELNNPLTAILGYAQIVSSLEDAEREHALRTIESEAQRASRIVRNLLAFARQRPGDRRLTDLEGVLRRILDLRRYSLEVDEVRVITRFGHVPPVLVDEGQFEQAFLNLLANAHQALEDGGGEVLVSTWSTAEHLYISFADDGPGVPGELRARVWDPFFTTREVGAGEGMGLSIVYGVVANHGGRTWVETAPTGGANFVIQLPLVAPEPRVTTPPATTPPATTPPAPMGARPRDAAPASTPSVAPSVAGEPAEAGEPPRILVVDDEPSVRALTREILAAQGYPVAVAEDGPTALRMLAEGDYGLVITDLRMPGLSGSDLYHEIQHRWPHLASRVLFVTGDIEGERGGRALDREQIRYLEKPFTTQQLLAAIRDVLATPQA